MIFDVGNVDFPWWFPDRPVGGKIKQLQYPTMKIDEIYRYAEKFRPLFKNNAILFSWINTNLTTDSDLRDRLKTFEIMGFRNTGVAFTWVKVDKSGKKRLLPGHYQSNTCEFCFLGIKGSAKNIQLDRWMQVIEAPIEEQSKKPDIFREEMKRTTTGRRIEFFARKTSPGWDVWGNEVESDIIL